MSENLWGELPESGQVRIPVTILREQATVLGELTENVLSARVRGLPLPTPDMPGTISSNRFVYAFDILAPAMQGYSVTLLYMAHDVGIYPVFVFNVLAHRGQDPLRERTVEVCKSEENFKEVLRQVLTSENVRNALRLLIAESKAVG